MRSRRSRYQLRKRTHLRQRTKISWRKGLVISIATIVGFSIVYIYGNFGNVRNSVASVSTGDRQENADLIPSSFNWTSANAAFSTALATPDQNVDASKNVPENERWFKVTASSTSLTMQVKTGGSFGSMKFPIVSIRDSTGRILSSNRLTSEHGILELCAVGLTKGLTYYISVGTPSNPGYRGTFSLSLNDQPTQDFREGAILLTPHGHWSSVKAAFTTEQGTPDGEKGSNWDTGPNYNVWFKFYASTEFINIGIKSGGSFGTLKNPYAAIWDSSGRQVASAKFSSQGEVQINSAGLKPGQLYFISVDNSNSPAMRGTFTLRMDDRPSNDYFDGAMELNELDKWSSSPAEYSTENATADKRSADCWGGGPYNNRWFKFQASSHGVHIEVRTGDEFGTMRYPLMALWNSSMNIVDCSKSTEANGMLSLNYSNLKAGNWYYISIDNKPGCSGTFTLFVNKFNLLPIQLASFRAKTADQQVLVQWKTVNEPNNEYFIVERSPDGFEYETVGTVVGSGNGLSVTSYEFKDSLPPGGSSYYRLKQIHSDGKVEIFDPYLVTKKSDVNSLRLISAGPNPMQESLNLEVKSPYQGEMNIELRNSDGVLIRTEKRTAEAGKSRYTISGLGDLKQGVYLLNIFFHDVQTESVRLVKN